MSGVTVIERKRHLVTEVIVQFSGPLNPAKAGNFSSYHLAMAGKKVSFAARKATSVSMRLPSYNGNSDTVTLVPLQPFALTRPVQVVISGTSSTGLTDSQGRLIDGNGDGRAGSNGVVMVTRDGVTWG
jgi:hypothetical protein